MRNLAILALAALVIGCSPEADVEPQPGSQFSSTAIADFKDLRLGDPISEGALTLIPVSTSVPQEHGDDYVTLAEAKKQGWIEIIEIPDEANVSTLRVHYTGERPLLLLAGELLLGGKQDRVVAKDTVIKPGDTIDVMVYCVEPGRWNGSSMHFDAQVSTVPLETKERALLGNQQEVWDSVGEYNAKAAPQAEGTSLKYGYSNTVDSQEFKDALERLMSQLEGRKNVVGVVIALNGKTHSFEYFGSPRLFQSSSESILRGALASALVDKGSGGVPDMDEVADFISRSLKSTQNPQNLAQSRKYDDSGLAVSAGVPAVSQDSQDRDRIVHGTFYDKSKD